MAAPRPANAEAAPPRKRGRDPLLAAICHDLRAPLAAVTMGANFVLQTTPNDEQNARSRRILEAMLRSCAQMERLVRNFADLSEIEGDAVNLRLGLHDVGEMLDIAAEAARDTAKLRAVEIVVNKPEHRVAMSCDRDRVLRAVGHLVENAVKAAPEGTTVTLALTERGKDVELSVTDRGAGLAPQVRRNLFDREWHAKRANRVGAGFGLAIARGFAVSHGGRLHVESRANTTSFTLVLPKAGPPSAEPPSAPSHADRAPSTRRPRAGKRTRTGA